MQITAAELCRIIQGKIEGNPEVLISQPAKIEEATEGTVSFVSNPKYLPFVYSTKASVIIIQEDIALEHAVEPTLIRVQDPYSAFAMLLEKFGPQIKTQKGVHDTAVVSENSTLAADVSIGAFSFIGEDTEIGKGSIVHPQVYIGENVKVGEGTVLFPGVRIYAGCKIGNNCILHSGVVIGSDGFGFSPGEDGRFKKVPQTGNVIVGNDVEVGANTVIDRATLGSTRIKDGVKLDNLIQIAHNVEIGENSAVAAQAGISGSTKVGKHCLIGGQAGLVGHIEVADQTRINAQSGLAKAVKEPGKSLTGSPAFDYSEAMKSQAVFKKLPQIYKDLYDLQRRLERLEEQTKHGG